MSTHIQLRRGTAASWTSANPVLVAGEPGLETDTGKLKIGDGTAHWATLPYFNPGTTPGGGGAPQEQADWNEADNTKVDFIKNKPTIPSTAGLATETYVDTEVQALAAQLPGTILQSVQSGRGISVDQNDGANPIVSLSAPSFNLMDFGADGGGDHDNTTEFQAALAAIQAAGGGELVVPKGNWLTSGIVIQNMSNFTIRGERGSNIWIKQSTADNPFVGLRNIFTIADCNDFTIKGLTIDGRRDTIAPQQVLTANVTAGQNFVMVPDTSAYCVGMRLNLLGGLTANANADQDKKDMNLVVSALTATKITFTTNIANNYTAIAGSAISDDFGPVAANGAYITPWQTGELYAVAGRTLSEEDQQQGIHLMNCTRFIITENNVRNMWESPIRMGTHVLDGTAQGDGCSYGTISNNILTHCDDQGVGIWLSNNITVTGNVINNGGWAGVCMTISDDCVVDGNIINGNIQRIPGDTKSGSGVAIEGGRGNVVSSNKISGNYGAGIYLTAGGTFPFGGPAQVAAGSGSNNLTLPAATIGLDNAVNMATSGSITIMSSTGAQQIYYTGKTGNNLTGCTGGNGKLYYGYKAAQYNCFINATPELGDTTLTVNNGTQFQVNGRYSIIDGPKTERIDVKSIAGNVLTLKRPLAYRHLNKTQIGQTVCENNLIVNNSIIGTNDAGIRLSSAVRTNISNNVVDRAGLRGIDLGIWIAGGLQSPHGTVISGNSITAPDSTADGANYEAIYAERTSDLTITNNRCGGALATQGYYTALHIQAVSDSVISGNQITDAFGVGVRLDNHDDGICKRLTFNNNEVLRTLNEGIIVYGGDSLVISGNLIVGCAPNNGPGGYGGALDIRGVQNSEFNFNVVNNNGHGGIGLDNANIGGVNFDTKNNIFAYNIVRDDGANVDAQTGVISQQGHGIKEFAAGQGPNSFIGNQVKGTQNDWDIQSFGNTFKDNLPASKYDLSTQPTTEDYATAMFQNKRSALRGTATLASGEGRLYYFTAGQTMTFNVFAVGVGATGATGLTLARFGLYTVADDGSLTLVASTPNDTTGWGAAFTGVHKGLSAAYTVQKGRRYATMALFVGTTPPLMNAAAGSDDWGTNSFYTGFWNRLCGKVVGLTDLPATVAEAAIANTGEGVSMTLLT